MSAQETTSRMKFADDPRWWTIRERDTELHICGCVTHFDEDRWTSVTDSQCEFHATQYPEETSGVVL